jgi:hypothetical protein
MIALFDQPWQSLDLDGLRAFLSAAGEEGVTWEAKADGDKQELHPDSIRKAACGLANRVGGFLIIGARWDREAQGWALPGIRMRDEEPKLWIGKVLRGLRPVPRFDPNVWTLDDGRLAAVVWIEPVDEPPCMTPQGQVFERVSGETLPVRDPAHLDALFQRGIQAREAAERFARRSAGAVLEVPDWYSGRAVGLSLAMAAVGRESDDISSRLFVPSFQAAMWDALRQFVTDAHPERSRFGPDSKEQRMEQAGMAVLEHFGAGPMQKTPLENRSTWVLRATWDGAVAASVALSPQAAERVDPTVEFFEPAWREVSALVRRLGGYGAAHVTVGVFAAPKRPSTQPNLKGGGYVQPPPAAPRMTLYGRLDEETRITRWATVGEPALSALESLQRELERASGHGSLEPE